MLQKNPAVPLATSVSFTLNGQPVVGVSDETILQTAERHGVEIPRLWRSSPTMPGR
jgi:formate dehydrogenase major subunit